MIEKIGRQFQRKRSPANFVTLACRVPDSNRTGDCRFAVFNDTKGTLFIAVLVHTSFDMVLAIVNRLFPVPIVNDYGSNVPVLIGLGLLALVLIALT